MVKLTEALVLARSRATDLGNVRKFNCWGSDLTDVRIIRQMPNVQVLSLSVNKISTLSDFSHCKNLEELYIRKNDIQELNEICFLKCLPKLRILWLSDNQCATEEHYRLTVLKHLPNLQKLDNIVVQSDEVNTAIEQGDHLLPPQAPTESLNLRPARDVAHNDQDIVSASMPVFSVLRRITANNPAGDNQKSTHEIPSTNGATTPNGANENDEDSKPVSKPSMKGDGIDGDEETGKEKSNAATVKTEEEEGAVGGIKVTRDRVVEDTTQDVEDTAQDVEDTAQNVEDTAQDRVVEDPDNPDTLSWEETNKIRIQLGLKPLALEKMSPKKPRNAPIAHSAKSRNANLLQAVIHIVRELDPESLEIVADAIRNRLDVL